MNDAAERKPIGTAIYHFQRHRRHARMPKYAWEMTAMSEKIR